MKEFKRFVAGLAILGVVIISVIVAFRLAPETWAVLAGIVFGVVAALPMCAIVVLLLRQRPAPPPGQQPVTPAQPQIILMHPGVAADPRYMAQLPAAPMLPAPPPAYAWPMPAPQARQATAPQEWLDAEPEEEGAEWEPTPYAAPARVMAPAASARPTYRILGDS